ncbi:MAG: efflux RND transporter periplasmic adaptor subunit [Rubrivivax sp.]|nr:efflux RND transporter periplasmic adaptor subunit [Rubrivivax sp.]
MQRPSMLALMALTPALGGVPALAQTGPAAPPAAAPSPRVSNGWIQPLRPAGLMTVQLAPPAAAPAPGNGTPPGMVPGLGAAGGSAASKAHRGSVACLIGAERTADIGTAVTGVVAAIRVDRGDVVKRGQTLVLLEQDVERANLQAASARSAIEAELRSAEASLLLARDRHDRMASLADSGAVSQINIEQARAEREVAEQRVQQAQGQRKVALQEMSVAQAQLSQRTLRAPFDAVVVDRLVHEGERVEDKPVLRLAQLDPLRVELVLPSSRWGQLKKGDSMSLVPDLPGASRLLATVTHVDRTLDAASNTFRVRLTLPNPGHAIPAGARCRAEGLGDAPSATPAASPAPPAATAAPAQMSRAPDPATPLAPRRATPAAPAASASRTVPTAPTAPTAATAPVAIPSPVQPAPKAVPHTPHEPIAAVASLVKVSYAPVSTPAAAATLLQARWPGLQSVAPGLQRPARPRLRFTI